MAYKRRRGYGKRPRSYKSFFARKRRRVSYKTPFRYGGIVR